MRKKERYEKVIAWFQDNIPVAETELHYNNPYELLIAVSSLLLCIKIFRLRKHWLPLRRK